MASTLTSTEHRNDDFARQSAVKNPYRSDAVVLAIITFVSYLALVWQFVGPTYQLDEIGYLANAATLSGRSIDAGSSYHFGYSLFLLPGFLLFDDPLTIWKSVLVTNSLLFAISIFLLHRISGYLSEDRWPRFFAVLLCALYPAYPTMAGYAYSTPAIMLVFVAASWALCRSATAPGAGLLGFGLLVGLLSWTHPTGLPVAVAAILVLGAMAWLDRKRMVFAAVATLTIVLMIVIFRAYLNPHLLDIMTPDGLQPRLHYSAATDHLALVFSAGGPSEFLTRFLIQIGYVLIVTLALASGGVVYMLDQVALLGDKRRRDDPARTAMLAFAFLSLLGVAALTAVVFTKPQAYLNNYWVHGRYLEAILAPFLLISLLCGAARLKRLVLTITVLALLIFLYWAFGQETGFTDEIELPAFWPQVFYPDENILFWFLAGGIACLIAVMVHHAVVKLALGTLFIFCIANQVPWHHQSFRVNGSPSDLYRLVSDSFEAGECVAFTPAIRLEIGNQSYERYNQLSFYLMNYDYRRMEIADWAENCDGPYLTHENDPAFELAGAELVAQGVDTGLKVYARKMAADPSHETYSRLFVRDKTVRPATYIARINADDLWGRTGVGELTNGVIKTTGREGHVFYGPYGYLPAGKLRLKVYGRASNVDKSWVDVVSNGGNRKHGVFPLALSENSEGLMATAEIELLEDLSDFELRMHAGEQANIDFSHYDLEIFDD
ncbi:MAG: hypothetical protein NXI27_04495 [Alphaproteobacteria bacterium]|nr:hypothetical protein [Alphaproteobacteria bacterium]